MVRPGNGHATLGTMSVPQSTEEYRLVLYQTVNGAEGSLFPPDATAFTPPVFTFQLPVDQELPRLRRATWCAWSPRASARQPSSGPVT